MLLEEAVATAKMMTAALRGGIGLHSQTRISAVAVALDHHAQWSTRTTVIVLLRFRNRVVAATRLNVKNMAWGFINAHASFLRCIVVFSRRDRRGNGTGLGR